MAYVLEVETRYGVFEEMRDRSLSAVLAEMSDRLRKGEGAGVLRLRNARTNELLFRDRLGRDASPSQHVQVKSAVESQFETVGSGGKGRISGALKCQIGTVRAGR